MGRGGRPRAHLRNRPADIVQCATDRIFMHRRPRVNVRICRVASADWRPGRVYFLTLLEPLAGTTGLWPLPPGRPVPATVGELSTTVDWFYRSCRNGSVWSLSLAGDLVSCAFWAAGV